MKTCQYCGAVLPNDDLFCGMCGKRIVSDSISSLSRGMDSKTYNASIRGIILTDTSVLSTKLKVSRAVVLSVLNKYIKEVSPFVSYTLVDASEENTKSLNPHSHFYMKGNDSISKDWQR